MKHLYEASAVQEVTRRIALLRPESERQWGKMNAAQAAAHCAAALEMAVGDTKPPRIWVGRIIGGLVKRLALAEGRELGRNAPTTKELKVADERVLETEKARLTGLVERFAKGGSAGCTRHPHPFFGRLTGEEWGVLMYKHLDHHLRQFGV